MPDSTALAQHLIAAAPERVLETGARMRRIGEHSTTRQLDRGDDGRLVFRDQYMAAWGPTVTQRGEPRERVGVIGRRRPNSWDTVKHRTSSGLQGSG
jgi:hypothetical protein